MDHKSIADKTGKSKRKTIPLDIRQQVLMESGYKCGRPICRNIITLDLHHLIYVSNNGKNDTSNLLPLCGYCHDMHHAKQFPTEALRFWKGLLLALNQAFDQKSMDLLLYLTKQFEGTTYSGDGVLQFAGLIAAGLVKTGSSLGGGTQIRALSAHKVVLTEKGRLLVEAWLKGDENMYSNVLKLK